MKERKSVENERAMEKIAKRTQKRDLQTEAAMAIGKKTRKETRETRERGRSILATDHRSTTQGSVSGPLDGAEHLGIQKTVLARSRYRGRTGKNGPISRYLLCSCNVRGTYEVPTKLTL